MNRRHILHTLQLVFFYALLSSFVNGATYTVSSSTNSGTGSLRDIIAAASAGDTILFDSATDYSPILLESGISMSEELFIIGNGKEKTIIDGSGFDHSLFSVSARLSVYNLTMQSGGKPLAESPTVWGGAIYYNLSSDTLYIENCRFKDNSAYLGGAIRVQEGEMVLISCEFNGNESTKFGGAINARSSSGNNALLVNCLFYENHTDDSGGAIYAESNNNWKIINCTFTENSSGTTGGGFRNAGTSSLYLYNNIFYTNTAPSGGNDVYSATPTAATHNLLGDFANAGFSGGTNGNFTGDPGFANTSSGKYGLKTNSPAKNAGDQTQLPGGITTDIIGSSRITDSEIDLGAFEFQPMLYVKYNATGSSDGSSWSNAYTDLQDALYAASQGSVIWVARGTYKPTGSADRNVSFEIPDSVKVYGGFYGGEASNFNLDDRNISSYETILSGDIGQTSDSLDNSYNVIYTKNVSAFTEVNGFTIKHGNATDSGERPQRGGGWYNTATAGNESSPTLSKCKFLYNTASYGGGFYCNADEPTAVARPEISFCTFSYNSATNSGGAIFNDGAEGACSPIISNSTFFYNSASYGGAIYNNGLEGISSPIISNCTFLNNSALSEGAGIYMLGDDGDVSASIINCVFDSNGEDHIGYDDGNENTQPHFINCTFYGATSRVINIPYFDSGKTPIDFTNCLFENNNGDIVGTTNVSHAEYGANSNVNIQYSIVEEASFAPANNNINADPLFKNGAGGDFRLKLGSPAINSGSNAAVPSEITMDLAGKGRVNGGIVDRGAFEFASRLYVNHSAGGANTGANWADAFSNLNTALGATEAGTEVWVAKGSYSPNSGSAYYSFHIPDSVKIYGGFDGTESTLNERRVWENETILDGNDAVYHVVKTTNVSTACQIDGFTIQGGSATINEASSIIIDKYGGGLVIYSNNSMLSSPTIKNCRFRNNVATYGGGGLGYFTETSGQVGAIIENCIFENNYVENGDGGGAYIKVSSDSAPFELTNCVFAGNRADEFGSRGGGLYLFGESGELSLPVTNCSFISNYARYGGGIYASSSATSMEVSIINTLIYNNEAWGSSGGPDLKQSIEFNGATATYDHSLVEYNLSTSNGNISGDTDPGILKAIDPYETPTDQVDFRLSRCSPLINAGQPSGSPATDVFGKSSSGVRDIGAHEFTGNTSSTIIYVIDDVSTTGDGSSWQTAFKRLPAALNANAACGFTETIWVAGGSYLPSETNDRLETFELNGDTQLFGGFAGNEVPSYDLTLRNFETNETILSGDIGVEGNTADNSLNVILLSTSGQTSVIDGFTISGARADSSEIPGYRGTYGGGILSQARTGDNFLTLKNCTVENNYVENSGGGILNTALSGFTASVAIEKCRFLGNTADFSSGAIESDASSSGKTILTVKNTEFRGSSRGAVRNIASAGSSSTFRCEGCLFSGNQISSSGGSFTNYNAGGTAFSSLINCSFSGNSAFQGSAIWNRGGTVYATNSIFWNNADFSAGQSVFTDNGGTTTIKNSLIEGINDNTNGNIPSIDPKFVEALNPASAPSIAGDFKLKNCSPVADKGLSDSINVSLDLAGNTRIFNDTGLPSAIVDLGAYEHQGYDAPLNNTITDDINSPASEFTEFLATNSIMGSGKIIAPSKVIFRAGNSISLTPGFEAENSTVFKAEIGAGCP